MFAKLYGDNDNQVLVQLRPDEENKPQLRFSVEPPGLGVCEMALGWADTEEGWTKAEKAFAKIDEKSARSHVKPLLDQASALAPESP